MSGITRATVDAWARGAPAVRFYADPTRASQCTSLPEPCQGCLAGGWWHLSGSPCLAEGPPA